jgi:YVTN family beta-propeller protein
MNKLFFYLLIISSMLSCRRDEPPVAPIGNITIGEGGVYITNEGNFMFGNASVSYYDPENNSVVEDLFQSVNSTSLGDICQSMTFFNSKIYIVVNNSGKVKIVNASNFEEQGEISGLTSPRYFLPVSNNKAYVTDLYSNSVSVVDLNSNSISGNIPCAGATEELVLSYGNAFVTNSAKEFVYVINTSTDQITDSILVSRGGNSIAEDKNGKLWVLCGGNSSLLIPPSLYRIHPVSKTVELSYSFPQNDSPWRLTMNGGNDTLYFLNNGIYKMSIEDINLPAAPFISEGTMNFYGLGIDPLTGIIYVSDAIDYVQRGMILRYQPNGILINSFLAGIIPGDFYFED